MAFLNKISDIFTPKPVEVPPYPSLILMEVTNACNLRCSMCFIYGEGVKRRRATGFMKRELWQQAIDEMGSWPAKVTLDLHGAGEPLLHPELFEIISYAKSKANISVGFLSNATLLTREKADAVIETGLDWIGFSVDGAQKEIFESYRKGAVLEEVEANIDYLLSIRKPGIGEPGRPTVYLNMVCHPEADTGLFIDRWKGKVETILLSIKKINDKGKNIPAKFSKPCFLLSQQLIMGWDGTTVLCCEDFCEEYVTGRFPEMSLSGIWHGARFDKARQHHHKGTFDKIDLCRYCDSVVFHQYAEKVIEVNGRKTLVRTELASKQE